MQQFASLRQKAYEGDHENFALLQQLQQQPDQTADPESDWDMSLNDVYNKYGTAARSKPPATDENQDSLTYYKAVAASKRGEDALVDHVQQKSEKQMRAHEKNIKRQRVSDSSELDGIRLSDRNRRFNDRLERDI